MTEILTTRTALNRALADELAANDRVLVFGEDVGRLGGIFRVTDGLQERFGRERVFDTPASEAGIAGVAIGLALAGFLPVVEMQFAAYAYPALEQIVDHLAKYHLRTQGVVTLPVVIRMPVGRGGGKEHHAESPESLFAAVPGLKVVSPSGPLDAYDLLTQAVRDPDPVLVLEPIALYDEREAGIPGEGAIPMYQATVRRAGTDLTLLSYGATTRMCLETAETLAVEGIRAQVLDLRSLAPLDVDSIRDTVRSTGRAVVVHDGPLTMGLGAEIVARLTEECFDRLAAPPVRVAGWDTPYPPPMLADGWWPSVERIAAAARSVMEPPHPGPADLLEP